MDEDDQKLTDDTNASQDKPYDGDQRLPNDGPTPAAPPNDIDEEGFPVDYPTTDTDMDKQEEYDAGTEAAAGGPDADQEESEGGRAA